MAQMQTTLAFVKPKACEHGLISEILTPFEQAKLKVVGARVLTPSEVHAKEHYEAHIDKEFYQDLITHTMSGPIFVFALHGDNAVELARKLVGETDSAEAAKGTIRGDLFEKYKEGSYKPIADDKNLRMLNNFVHCSDTVENAEREIRIWFPKGVDYKSR